MITTKVTCDPVPGNRSRMDVLFHPSMGRLELGMSNFFLWRAMPL